MKQCKKCKKFSIKNRAERISNGGKFDNFRYRNENGKRWEGNNCPACVLHDQTIRRHIRGRSRFIDPIPIHAKGIKSENIIKEIFEKSGYSVKQSTMIGPDLIIKKGEEYFTCEVKSIVKCANANSWYVGPVSKYRTNDDFIALVLDDKNIIFEKLSDHLMKCSISGRRPLTKEVKSMLGLKICIFMIFAYLCIGCTQVQIKDEVVFADRGPLGATIIHTLEPGIVHIDKNAWDQSRVGMLCVSPETFADWKKDIETLCSYTNSCSYPTINAFFTRVDSSRLVSPNNQ